MSTSTGQSKNISFGRLHAFTRAAFEAVGMSSTDAEIAADVLARTDAWGVSTHGTNNLHHYLRLLKAGGLDPHARPEIVKDGPAWAIVDGQNALGIITGVHAMRTAITKARTAGVAYVGVRNGGHFGAAGYYSWLAAKEGLIGLSMANDVPSVAAPGSRGAITGSNPLSYSLPSGRHPPVTLDMSIATVAGGKVYAARNRGEPIPDNWLIDSEGKPTTDPSGYPQKGALQPAAGHKGYGLGLLIETLSGVLSGAAVTTKVGSWIWGDPAMPTNHGAAFLAIDVQAIMSLSEYSHRMETMIDEIHSAPRADGVKRLFVPGEMEWERHDQAMSQSLSLPSNVIASLRKAAEMSGLDLDKFLDPTP